MISDISPGVYYPGKSFLHRLQARTKLVALCCMVVALVVANQHMWHFAPYGAAVLIVVIGVVLSGIGPREMWRRLWFLLVITLISAVLSLFALGASSPVLAHVGPIGVPYGLARVVLLSVSGGLLALLLVGRILTRRSGRQRRWLKRLRIPIVIIEVCMLLFVVITYRIAPGVLLVLGPLVITYNNVWVLVGGFVGFFTVYICSLLLTMTTLPVALVEGMSMLLAPLRRLKLPVDDFALMTLLALRFIPTLFDEAEQLMNAQMARGADLLHGTLRERVQSLAMFFVPLVQGTLRHAADLATALEARGYRSEGKQTWLHETRLGAGDIIVLGVVIVIMGVALLM